MSLNLILNYLTALEQNNNREWYHSNKTLRQEANEAFEALVYDWMIKLHDMDPAIPIEDPKTLIFKQVRDTRFSHDKSPYNPSFRAHIGPQGKLPVPVGYYLMLQPGDRSFLGGGLFADMFKEATALVRDYIAAHPEELQAIITAPAFVRHFTLQGTALKKVPQGYDPSHPQSAYLRHKSWYLEYPLSDARLRDASDTLSAMALDVFHAMKPFNTYLNTALSSFQMPSR